MLQQAKNEGLTINVRHAKILFCGASCAGKTSFSRLLRNKKHENVYISTPAGDAHQVLLSGEKVNVEGSSWRSLDSKLEIQELTKRLIQNSQNNINTNEPTDSNVSLSNNSTVAANNEPTDSNVSLNNNSTSAANIPPVNTPPTTGSIHPNNQITTEVTTHSLVDTPHTKSKENTTETIFAANDKHRHSSSDNEVELHNDNISMQTRNQTSVTEEEMVTFTDGVNTENPAKVPKTWDLFTLLDTGGQPEFINLLPAINSSTAITFVVLNISDGNSCLNASVVAQYKCKGFDYSECALKYTNKHLLQCLLSSVKVAALKKDYFHPEVIKETMGDKQSQPIVAIIGTCADVLKGKVGENYNEELYQINKEIAKVVEAIQKENVLLFWCDASKNYIIPVDNTIHREPQEGVLEDLNIQNIQHQTAENIQRIRDHSNKILRNKAQYEIPISWFILELELRNNDKVCIPLTEVKEICDRIMPSHRKMEMVQIIEVLKFYHLYGMLLYFSEVEGMKNFVITNPQWLFVNLTKIIMCKFEYNANDLYGANHIEEMHNGICYIELLRRLKLDLQNIELESFINLLVHLKIIAPMMNNGYFMPTILPPCNEEIIFTEEYGKPSAFALNGETIHQEVEPLLIEFTFGTIPRGLFGFLIVQLLQDNPHTYEVYGKNDDVLRRCADLISFYIKPCYYVTLCDRISYLELQVRVKDNKPSYYYRVQSAVTEALKKVCSDFNWEFSDCRYGFLCSQHKKGSTSNHLTLLSTNQPFPTEFPEYAYCKSQQPKCLNRAHSIWFEVRAQFLATFYLVIIAN